MPRKPSLSRPSRSSQRRRPRRQPSRRSRRSRPSRRRSSSRRRTSPSRRVGGPRRYRGLEDQNITLYGETHSKEEIQGFVKQARSKKVEMGHDAIIYTSGDVCVKLWERQGGEEEDDEYEQELKENIKDEITNHVSALEHNFLHAPTLFASSTDGVWPYFLVMENITDHVLLYEKLLEGQASYKQALQVGLKNQRSERRVHLRSQKKTKEDVREQILSQETAEQVACAQSSFETPERQKKPHDISETPWSLQVSPTTLNTITNERLKTLLEQYNSVTTHLEQLVQNMCKHKFLHGDLKTDNMFVKFNDDNSVESLRVFDFEFCTIPSTDLDFLEFLKNSLYGLVNELQYMPYAEKSEPVFNFHNKFFKIVLQAIEHKKKQNIAVNLLQKYIGEMRSRGMQITDYTP